MPHPVAVPADVDDVAVMDEPVDEGCGHDFIAEDVAPFRKTLVGGEHGTCPLIPLGHELEEEHRAGAADGQIADLVDDEE